MCVIPVWQATQAGCVFWWCSVGLNWQAELEEPAAAGAMRRRAAEMQRSEEPAVEPPGAQRATFTYKKQSKLTLQHVAHLEKNSLNPNKFSYLKLQSH